jgi:hypothetical protein
MKCSKLWICCYVFKEKKGFQLDFCKSSQMWFTSVLLSIATWRTLQSLVVVDRCLSFFTVLWVDDLGGAGLARITGGAAVSWPHSRVGEARMSSIHIWQLAVLFDVVLVVLLFKKNVWNAPLPTGPSHWHCDLKGQGQMYHYMNFFCGLGQWCTWVGKEKQSLRFRKPKASMKKILLIIRGTNL